MLNLWHKRQSQTLKKVNSYLIKSKCIMKTKLLNLKEHPENRRIYESHCVEDLKTSLNIHGQMEPPEQRIDQLYLCLLERADKHWLL